MHYHTEIVIPPCDDVKAAISEVMEPFCECNEDASYGFWDFFTMGGRWAGTKMMAAFDKKQIDVFYAALETNNVTVSGIQFGKQEISPASLIPLVDKLWHECLPDAPEGPCPIFRHSNDQFESDSILGSDIQLFKDVYLPLTVSRVIFAAPDYEGKKLEAKLMLSEDMWNGVNHQKTRWECTFKHAVEMFKESMKNWKADYAEKMTPKDDWLVVTVDYHS